MVSDGLRFNVGMRGRRSHRACSESSAYDTLSFLGTPLIFFACKRLTNRFIGCVFADRFLLSAEPVVAWPDDGGDPNGARGRNESARLQNP